MEVKSTTFATALAWVSNFISPLAIESLHCFFFSIFRKLEKLNVGTLVTSEIYNEKICDLSVASTTKGPARHPRNAKRSTVAV